MAMLVATATPAIQPAVHGGITVRLCALRRADGCVQLACAHRDLVLLSSTFSSEGALRHAAEQAGVPGEVARSSMFTREVELSREQLQSLGFGTI